MIESLQIRKNVGQALPDYSRDNVAGLLVGSGQTAISHIPAYTLQFFERLEANNHSARGNRAGHDQDDSNRQHPAFALGRQRQERSARRVGV
jgi:hypothetical protein